MPSARNPVSDDAVLDAAREAILAVGWSRTTLTDVARRAGVSRMTIYRRWPEMRALLADLLTREWTTAVEPALRSRTQDPLERIVDGVVTGVRALRDNELLARITDVDPELLLPYLTDRWGSTQRLAASHVRDVLLEGHADGLVLGDHLDVIGHFESAGATFLRSGSKFDEGRFRSLWSAVASGL